MKIFRLHRKEDVSGVSGKGIVAYGFVLETGKAILTWHTEFNSVAVYDSLDILEKIHSHGDSTLIEIFDPKKHGRSFKSIDKFINGKDLEKKEIE